MVDFHQKQQTGVSSWGGVVHAGLERTPEEKGHAMSVSADCPSVQAIVPSTSISIPNMYTDILDNFTFYAGKAVTLPKSLAVLHDVLTSSVILQKRFLVLWTKEVIPHETR
jgi:hypothetical protein